MSQYISSVEILTEKKKKNLQLENNSNTSPANKRQKTCSNFLTETRKWTENGRESPGPSYSMLSCCYQLSFFIGFIPVTDY